MDNNCTVYKTADFIGKKWTMLILLEIYRGSPAARRYSELKKGFPDITPKILSLRLKELEQQGLVKKKIDSSSFPVKCHYSLTNSGNDFIKIIQQIKGWALKWKSGSKICKDNECKDCTI